MRYLPLAFLMTLLPAATCTDLVFDAESKAGQRNGVIVTEQSNTTALTPPPFSRR
ncbi:MAG TPA: hypothetical protein VER58_05195 [Thermoanaerobaculia bacterium]|nr:hypothetical protein [Thermoanaerobaculia bacterium]